MRPFSSRMFPDQVALYRGTAATGGQGESDTNYPDPPEFLRADVQTTPSTRMELDGRTAIDTSHTVLTPSDPAAKANDKFVWQGRNLIVQARSDPAGIPDRIWKTKCLEAV